MSPHGDSAQRPPDPPAEDVSLVIPGRNAAATLGACLDSVVPLLERGELREILFVDDGSTDGSGELARPYPVRCLPGTGRGPGAARNLGWKAASSPLIWFIDADCVAEDDSLALLLDLLSSPEIAGAGGSYGNMRPGSLVATLIHEEIVERHLRMPREVDFLATFNVVYRRSALEQVGGFDEHLLKAQDAELAYRIRGAGGRLLFEPRSRVGHFHETSLRFYLKTQRQQGFWRMWLYRRHPQGLKGDSYSGWIDHLQPPLAMLILGLAIPAALGLPGAALGLGAAALALVAAQLPMTWRLIRRTGDPRLTLFAPFSGLRAFWRGIGMTAGLVAAGLGDRRERVGSGV